jgi:hypothetical protein
VRLGATLGGVQANLDTAAAEVLRVIDADTSFPAATRTSYE